jgi:hypothetical protein
LLHATPPPQLLRHRARHRLRRHHPSAAAAAGRRERPCKLEDWSARRLIKAASGEEEEALCVAKAMALALFVRARL